MAVDTTKVLPTIKKCLGIYEEDDSWDVDLIIAINSAMVHLNELGCSFILIDSNTLWSALTDKEPLKALMKTYFWMKTKQIFDPSQSSNSNKAMESLITELEFRIMVLAD